MTPENLRTHLSTYFELLLFQDLATLLDQHRRIFDVFKSAYKSDFQPNQRLVFYSSHEPEQDLLDHVQRAAAKIDISNFFILIVCPYDIRDKLSQSCSRHGDPNASIQSLMLPVIDTLPMDQSRLIKTKTLCPLPFAMSVIDQDSNVSPCCKFKGSVGNLREQSLTDIFHSTQMDRVRQQMRQGHAPRECEVCWQSEKSAGKSLRTHAQEKYGAFLDQHWLDDIQPRDVTWSPTSLCNFKCRVCSAQSSSSIAAEDIKFAADIQTKKTLQANLNRSVNDTNHQTIQNLIIKTQSVEYLHVMGGEPLLWPQNQSFVRDLVESGRSQKIHLEFNTNGSVFDGSLMEFIVDNFASLEVLLSIDNIGERFEIERGGSWPKIKRNIEKFAKLNHGSTRIKLIPTINIQNVLYLDDVCELAQSLDLSIVWWYLEEPDYLCIDYVTENAKKLIINKYQNSSVPELQKIAQRLRGSPLSDGKSFIEHVKKFDLRRNQKFGHTHKEIFEAMGGC